MKTKDVPNLEIKVADNGVIVMTKVDHGLIQAKSDIHVFENMGELFVFLEGYFLALQETK